MEENGPEQATNNLYAQLLSNLEAGKNLGDALLAQGEEAMDIFFLDPQGDWIKALPSSKENLFRKLLRRYAPFIKLGPLPLQ
jgi:hypothetical protein